MSNASINSFVTYYSHNKIKFKNTEFIYSLFFFWPASNLISLLGILFACIVKVFAIYYPYYKDKLIGNQTCTFVYTTNYLYFLCNCSHFLVAFFFTKNSSAWTTKTSLVNKKKKPSEFFLYFLSSFPLLLSLFFNLTFSKMYLSIFKYSAISKYAAIFK